jgi:thiol-disulfide isomerase/thioredoxin
MRRLVVVGLLLLWVVAGALSREEQSNPPVQPQILPVDEARLKQLVGEFEGKVVVLNFWATWCTPCMKEFPDLLRLRKTYRDRGLRLIFVSADDPKKPLTQVSAFLRRMKVDFPTYIKKTTDDEVFINSVFGGWSGAIPATFIYNRQGKLVHNRIDTQSFEQLVELVEPLLDM